MAVKRLELTDVDPGGFLEKCVSLCLPPSLCLSLSHTYTRTYTHINTADLAGVEQEMELLKKLQHPHIVTYVDAIRTERHLHILLEYMENGADFLLVLTL